MRRLIVNADDFGMAETVNLGIIKGHREGIVTSTTLLACGDAAEHAVRLAHECPSLGVGVHLCLTVERPASGSEKLPTLTSGGRLLPGPLPLMCRVVFGLVDKGEVESELRAQIERVIALGIKPTHVDGHQQLHVMPVIFPIVVRLALEFGIPAVRFPVGPWTGRMGYLSALEKTFLEGLSLSQKKLLEDSGLKRPDHFFGQARMGRLDTKSLLRIIKDLPEGTSELMCHPGLRDDALAREINWGKGWETELKAVTDEKVKGLVEKRGIELIAFHSL